MPSRIPTIEVPDNADAIRSRRPSGERNSALALVCDRVRAELVVDTQMLAFAEEMEIEIADGGRETADCVRSPTVRESRRVGITYARASDTLRLRAFA